MNAARAPKAIGVAAAATLELIVARLLVVGLAIVTVLLTVTNEYVLLQVLVIVDSGTVVVVSALDEDSVPVTEESMVAAVVLTPMVWTGATDAVKEITTAVLGVRVGPAAVTVRE